MLILFGRSVPMPIERIVIVGGGVAAWLSALTLAAKTSCAVILVDTGGIDDSLGLPVAIEASLPSVAELHARLDIDEDHMVAHTGSSYGLGRALSNWRAAGAVAFHPYGDVGANLGPVAFHHLMAHRRADGETVNLANYSVGALCAQTGRFAPYRGDGRSVLSTMAHGLHLPVDGYRHYLQNAAKQRGVSVIAGDLKDVHFDAEIRIGSVRLSTGQVVEGDFFLDCSGQARFLASRMPGYAFEDWSAWLPHNDMRISVTPSNSPPPLYAHIEAHEDGWQRFLSCQDRVEELVISRGAGSGVAGCYAFTNGRIVTPWTGNCLAIGGAAAVIEPVASTQLHLVTTALSRLLDLFPHSRESSVEATEYNRQTIEQLENARDYAILHFAQKDASALPVPERLAHRLSAYEASGRVALYDEETFETWDWIALFEALDITPRRYDVVANGIAGDAIAAHFERVRSVMLKAVSSLPPQQSYLQSLKAVAA